jgi:uncharacterized membrane protein YjjP (DUF1212 family)
MEEANFLKLFWGGWENLGLSFRICFDIYTNSIYYYVNYLFDNRFEFAFKLIYNIPVRKARKKNAPIKTKNG